MSKREDSIIAWCEKHRPDVTEIMKKILESRREDLLLLESIAFEAGRQFQKENPTLEPNNPHQYSD